MNRWFSIELVGFHLVSRTRFSLYICNFRVGRKYDIYLSRCSEEKRVFLSVSKREIFGDSSLKESGSMYSEVFCARDGVLQARACLEKLQMQASSFDMCG